MEGRTTRGVTRPESRSLELPKVAQAEDDALAEGAGGDVLGAGIADQVEESPLEDVAPLTRGAVVEVPLHFGELALVQLPVQVGIEPLEALVAVHSGHEA